MSQKQGRSGKIGGYVHISKMDPLIEKQDFLSNSNHLFKLQITLKIEIIIK